MKSLPEENRMAMIENITTPKDNPPQRKYGDEKVNRNRLSRLMRAILNHVDIDKGVERGELVESIFVLPRRYCGYFVDPCMRPNVKQKYERRYKRAQPTITRSLNKLERRGLVRLIRHGRYVKRINLTLQGRQLLTLNKEQDGDKR